MGEGEKKNKSRRKERGGGEQGSPGKILSVGEGIGGGDPATGKRRRRGKVKKDKIFWVMGEGEKKTNREEGKNEEEESRGVSRRSHLLERESGGGDPAMRKRRGRGKVKKDDVFWVMGEGEKKNKSRRGKERGGGEQGSPGKIPSVGEGIGRWRSGDGEEERAREGEKR